MIETIVFCPNHWTLPGGKVEEGETPEQAICREVEEELSVNLEDYTLFGKSLSIKKKSLFKKYVMGITFA